jgi:hypothetical protein
MYILVIDTETTTEKRFCYDLGWVVYDTIAEKIVEKRQFLVKEVWENEMLFSVAYYFEKKGFYDFSNIKIEKWELLMKLLEIDIMKYGIENAYAYNIAFDLSVFKNNCDWFKIDNPIEKLNAYDIWNYATNFIVNDSYIKWCLENEKLTDNQNIKGNAETIYQYLINDKDYQEKHNSLDDIIIEIEILKVALKNGANYNKTYRPKRIIKSPTKKELSIILDDKKIITLRYSNKIVKNNVIILES